MDGSPRLSHSEVRLARRGRNAQHPCLRCSHRSVAVPHRNRSVPQKANHLVEARCTLPRQRSPTVRNPCNTGPLPQVPRSLPKNPCGASATRCTSAKIQWRRTAPRASGRLFQSRFTCFQQSPQRGTSCRACSAHFSAKRNRKNTRRFAASSPLRRCLALLSLGNVVEQSTMQFSPSFD